MRKVLQFLVVVGLLVGAALFCYGDGDPVLVEDGYEGVDVTGSIKVVQAEIDSIYIDVAASSTQVVTITTSDETILTATDVTADAAYRPRVVVCGVTGSSLDGTTNAYEKFFIMSDTITVTVDASSTTTNDVTVYFRLKR